jgi:transcriptional regulator with XRE-family HTH domain
MAKLTQLAAVRTRRALSQRDLAALAGCGPATIARLETGATEARPSTVRKLAAALRVKPATLMTPLVQSPPPPPSPPQQEQEA